MAVFSTCGAERWSITFPTCQSCELVSVIWENVFFFFCSVKSRIVRITFGPSSKPFRKSIRVKSRLSCWDLLLCNLKCFSLPRIKALQRDFCWFITPLSLPLDPNGSFTFRKAKFGTCRIFFYGYVSNVKVLRVIGPEAAFPGSIIPVTARTVITFAWNTDISP